MNGDIPIPEFIAYDIDEQDEADLRFRITTQSKSSMQRFRVFTDALIDYVPTEEWVNRSAEFIAMIARACYLRGMYGYNQILAKTTDNTACKGYAAASYCRQSLDPRWVNNLRNYVNQAWQEKEYFIYAELSGTLIEILIDLGYTERALDYAHETIERVTDATKHDAQMKRRAQVVLLDCHIQVARISGMRRARDEALVRLRAAQTTADHFDHSLAKAKILYAKAQTLLNNHEYDDALEMATEALHAFNTLGYLEGVANARNLRGIIYIGKGQFQDARDQFEEQMLIQQQLNNQVGLAKTLINIGEIDRELGQIDQMQFYNLRALEISQEAEYMVGIGAALINLGDAAMMKGEIDEALKKYLEAHQNVSSCGLSVFSINTLFLAGDAYFLKEDYDNALEMYSKAREAAAKGPYPLGMFLADISSIVIHWMSNTEIMEELLKSVMDLMEPLDEWIDNPDPSIMTRLRRNIFDDDSVTSQRCVFFDREYPFTCRVDRLTMKKECFGNLQWMGGFCTYLQKFVKFLKEQTASQ